jgi:serine/threonine protein kinase
MTEERSRQHNNPSFAETAPNLSADLFLMRNGPQTAPLPATEPPLDIPDVEIQGVLGRGGMGVVYKGMQKFPLRAVAVKALSVEGALRDKGVERFQREAKLLAELHHPNIVSCYQSRLSAKGQLYLIMEYIAGPNLRQYIEDRGALSEALAIQIVRQIASALRHAGEMGVIHRDVEPSNVLLAPKTGARPDDPFPFSPKLADLGLAKYAGADRSKVGEVTTQGALLGTPAIMAPEQFDNPESVDRRADIYALGCLLYFLATGRHAFPQKTLSELLARKSGANFSRPSSINSAISSGFNRLVAELMEPDPRKRPQNYDIVLARLDAVASGGRSGRTRAPLIAAGAIMLLTLSAAGFILMGGKSDPSSEGATSSLPGLAERAPETVSATLPASAPSPKPDSSTPPDAPAEAAMSAEMGAETPPQASPPAEKRREFPAEGLSLLEDAEFASRWRRVGRGVNWGPPPEGGSGIVGAGRGARRLPLDNLGSAWRIEGTLQFFEGDQAALRVNASDGSFVALLFQNFDDFFLARSDSGYWGSGGEEAISGGADEAITLRDQREFTFAIQMDGRVSFEVNGQPIKASEFESGAAFLDLAVEPGVVLFRDLKIMSPKSARES